MLWLVWHMWILLLLAFAGGLIAGWILRSRSDEAPTPAALAAPGARSSADSEPSAAAPPAPHVPAPEPGADDPARTGPSPADASDSKVAAAFTAPDVSAPASAPDKTQSGAGAAQSGGKAGASTKTAAGGSGKAGAPAAADEGAGGADKDDLTAIKGLGPRAAEKLADAGVTRLSQIAAWSAADIEKYDALVNARGRIARDDWVGQARALSKT